MDIIQRSDLVFELEAWKPEISNEIEEWLSCNNISYNIVSKKYGPASFHYHLFLHFENIHDSIAFKLGWI